MGSCVIDVVVSGAAGRLGSQIAAAVEAAEGMRLVAALVRQGLATAVVATQVDDPTAAIVVGRVLMETAPHDSAVGHVELAAAAGVPAVVATTGFDRSEQARLQAAASAIPLVLAPNLSRGVTMLLDLVARAAAALPDCDVEIVEIHHNQKKDAPSGTAWALGEAAASARGQDIDRDAILARAGDVGKRGKAEIGIQTLRGGQVIGEHTVMLVGANERLELIHRAQSREVFAEGAVHALRFAGAAGRAPGLYSMRDVLALGSA